jgi:acylphosphatase
MKENRRLHIKVKRKTKNPFYAVFARVSAKRLGLKTHKFSQNKDKLEMVFEGNNSELWKMIEKCKKGVVFSYVEEVHFEFVKA